MTQRFLTLCSLLGLLLALGGDALAQKKKPANPAKKTEVQPIRSLVPPGTKLDALALAQLIDREIKLRLDADGIKASPRSEDAEFYRRLHLDLLGIIPTPEKVVAFLDSTDPNKRGKAIDEMLANPRFGQYQAELWAGLLLPRESTNRALQANPFRKWLAEAFNKNQPWDKLVYEFVTASGSQEANGATTFFIANPTPDKMTDQVAKAFLGVRVECAQCHNHPFTSWKQEEYWGLAAFFMNVRVSGKPQQAAKKGITIGVNEQPGAPRNRKGLPESAKFLPAKFLQGEQPKVSNKEPLRPVLAEWMTSKNNPFFARAYVNRIWHHFFGRGIVNPYDDMIEENEPTHPELLHTLAEQFKAHNFDIKYLIRAICNSEVYQRTSRPVGNNADFIHLFPVMAVRNLTPEQLYDSLTQVLGAPGKRDVIQNKVAGKKGAAGGRDQFLAFFRVEDANPLEYQGGIPQALRLMNSAQTNNPLQGVVSRASQGSKAPAQVIENIFLTVLSRRPTVAEMQRYSQYVSQQGNSQAAYTDIVWALLNSSEFALNH